MKRTQGHMPSGFVVDCGEIDLGGAGRPRERRQSYVAANDRVKRDDVMLMGRRSLSRFPRQVCRAKPLDKNLPDSLLWPPVSGKGSILLKKMLLRRGERR